MESSGAVPAPPVGTAAGQLFVATSPYNGDRTQHQLSFPAGAFLTALARRGEWYWGYVQGGGHEEEGYFPPAYVRAVEIPPPPPPPPAVIPAAAALAAKTKPLVDSRSDGAEAAKTTTTSTTRHPRWSPPQRDGSDIAAGTALAVDPAASSPSSSGGTRKRSRPNKSSNASSLAASSENASAPVAPAETVACTPKTTSNTVRIPIPAAEANGTRFPPGCSVLHDQSRGADGAGSVVVGVVRSVCLELSNPAFVPGSTYDISYVVASEGHWTDSSLTDVTPTPEKELQYAPRCLVMVSPSFLPSPTKSAICDKTKNDEYEDWARGKIVSSFQSFGGADESYVVTLEGADGGLGGRVSGVPREMIRYRPHPPSRCTSTSPAHPAVAAAKPAHLSGGAVAKVSDAALPSVKSNAKAAAPSSTRTVVDRSTKATEEDISNESSSITNRIASLSSTEGEKSNNNPVIVRRIDIPERIDFERVKSALVGPDRSINTQMRKKLHVDIYVIGHDLLPPKDANILHDLSPILPAASDRPSSFVMLRGSHNKVSAAAKVIIHLLVDRAYQGGDQDGLKKELNSAPVLQTLVAPTIDDLASLDEAMAEGTSVEALAGAKTSEGGPEGPASKKANAPAAPSTWVNTVDQSEGVTARIDMPRWLDISHVKSLFAANGLIEAILNASNCTVSLENTATQGKESLVFISIRGLEKNSVDYASTLVTDFLVESGVKEKDIERHEVDMGGSLHFTSPHLTADTATKAARSASAATLFRGSESKESRTRVKAESEDEPTPKRIRIEPMDEAGAGLRSNEEKFSESRLQFFPSWVNIDDINSQIIGREGEHKRTIELRIGCKIQVVDRRSPRDRIYVVVTSNCQNDQGRISKAMEYIEEQVLEVIEESQKCRFLYDMVLCNSNDADDNERHPIMYQRSLLDKKRMVWTTIVDFSDKSLPALIIGTNGVNVKRIRSKTGCTVFVYSRSEREPGPYVFVTSDDRESVVEAQQLVMDKIEEGLRKIVTANIECLVRKHTPLQLDQLKKVYSDEYGSSFDQKSFGYDQLIKFVSSIPPIYIQQSSNDGRTPRYFLHHKKKHKKKPSGTASDRETFVKQDEGGGEAKREAENNLYVSNLDDAVTEDILRKEFATMGTITSARVMKDPKRGFSRGFGFVCFSTPEEATRAINEMNGKIIGTKPISVTLARKKEEQPMAADESGSREVPRTKTQVAKAIDGIVRDDGPLLLHRIKPLYAEKFGKVFNHSALGYSRLKDFIMSISTIDIRNEGPSTFVLYRKEIPQKYVRSKTQTAKAIDAIVRDDGPLPLSRLKSLYAEKFSVELDYSLFGYSQLKDFIVSIPTIDVRNTGDEEGHKELFLHHKI